MPTALVSARSRTASHGNRVLWRWPSSRFPAARDRRCAMATERTFSIIKPDAVAKNVIGPITAKLEAAGLRILASKMVRLSETQAKAFYAVHKDRPFYGDLVKFMTEGPVVVQVLEGENAVAKNRAVMGATNPEKADVGTIRKEVPT